MSDELQEAISFITMAAQPNELDEIMNAIRQRRATFERQAKKQFEVGDEVTFNDNSNNKHQGMITKINRKNMAVSTSRGNWTVNPQFLVKVNP